MDFETLGAISGMQNDLKSLQRVAQAEIDRLAAVARAKNAEIAELQAQVAQLQAALAVETAFRQGITAQAVALKGELATVDAGNRLFQRTGKTFKSGKAHTVLCTVYESVFDAKAKELGIKDPLKFRTVAK